MTFIKIRTPKEVRIFITFRIPGLATPAHAQTRSDML